MKGETSAMVSARENIGFGGGGVWVVVEEEVEGGAPAARNSAMEKRGRVGRGGGAGGGAIPGAENLGVGYHDSLRYWRMIVVLIGASRAVYIDYKAWAPRLD